MRNILLLLIVVHAIIGMTSCSKIELEGDESASNSGGGDKTDADTVQTYDGVCCRVDELVDLPDDSLVAVKCFIVGYMPGRTVKNAVFGVDEDNRSTSNLVVADYAEIDNYEQCATIQLQSKSKAQQDLNLQDNPDKWQARVVLIGKKGRYNYATGLRNVSKYYLLQEGADADDNPNPDDDDKPEEPNAPTGVPAFPTVLDDEGEVFEGC